MIFFYWKVAVGQSAIPIDLGFNDASLATWKLLGGAVHPTKAHCRLSHSHSRDSSFFAKRCSRATWAVVCQSDTSARGNHRKELQGSVRHGTFSVENRRCWFSRPSAEHDGIVRFTLRDSILRFMIGQVLLADGKKTRGIKSEWMKVDV